MSFIFISYSRQDQAYVSQLAQALGTHRLPVWLDDRIDYGTNWPRIIQEKLERCQVFLLVMSPRSYDSHWVQCELSLALELKKPVYPLLLEGNRWLSVAALQTVDVRKKALPPAKFFDTVRGHFTETATTAEVISVQAVASDEIDLPTETETVRNITELVTGIKNLDKSVNAEANEDDLSSEKGIDYSRLQDLLKAQDWKAADRETYEVMIRAVGRNSGDYFRKDDLLNFPAAHISSVLPNSKKAGYHWVMPSAVSR